LYFYFYWIFIFISQKFFNKIVLLTVFLFSSYNYFTYFEQIGEVNNFFYFFTFKIINIVSNINFNLLIFILTTCYLYWLNRNSKNMYWFLLILCGELFFLKIKPYNSETLDQTNTNLLNGLFLIHPIKHNPFKRLVFVWSNVSELYGFIFKKNNSPHNINKNQYIFLELRFNQYR
jgi:hypothetical protein